MKAQDKAAVLIERAQAKGRADFEQWKEGYLSAKLKHRTGQEARAFLRDKYNALQDWLLANSSPKNLFDINTPQDQLARGWAACFSDWEKGLIPLPGRTPEYSAEEVDPDGNILGPFIPPSWLSPLAERFKVAFILEYIDSALQRKPKQQEASTKVLALYYWYLREAGLKPELHSGNGKKKALEAIAREHGISGQNLFQVFNEVGRNSDKNPQKLGILEKVIPLLSDYTEAQELAKKALDKLKKGTKE
jgi:hypothetical protein